MPLAQRSGLKTYELEDEAVVYDLARDTVHYLNRTARHVWACCDGDRSTADIKRELMATLLDGEACSIADKRIVDQGIGETIEMLQRDGLLRPHDEE